MNADPPIAGRHALHAACMGVATDLIPLLKDGGDGLQQAWAALFQACLGLGTFPDPEAPARLARSLAKLHGLPPDTFPDGEAAVHWAMETRPRMLAARDLALAAAAIPVPPARTTRKAAPRGTERRPPGRPRSVSPVPGLPATRNGRRIHEALAGMPPMRKADIARVAGLTRGSANRTVDELVDYGFLVPLDDGHYRLPRG